MARLLELGRRPYRDVLTLQRALHVRVASGAEPDTWLVVEHEPVITLGRNAQREHVLAAPHFLASQGIEIVPVERGGDATYHGPGQLVIYPIARLARFREVVPFVSALEGAVIAALRAFGIAARTRREHRGVYVATNAICAIGLAVKQMTSLHGLALNVSTELDYDELITPCGTPEFGLTSMSRELGRTVALGEARDALLGALGERLNIRFESEAIAC